MRNLAVKQHNQVWGKNITYIPVKRGFLYLVAIMDWYSRKVLSWQLSNKMDTHFCIEWLEEALDLNGRPDIFNTDQGSQFTSFDFISVLKENKIRISIDGKDRFLSNYLVEVWSASVFISTHLKMAFNHANKLVYGWVTITKLGLISHSKEKNNKISS